MLDLDDIFSVIWTFITDVLLVLLYIIIFLYSPVMIVRRIATMKWRPMAFEDSFIHKLLWCVLGAASWILLFYGAMRLAA